MSPNCRSFHCQQKHISIKLTTEQNFRLNSDSCTLLSFSGEMPEIKVFVR